ncbi:MAG: hypothetical protein K2O32_16355 [Acetatifactor sp.]|nr:hypothetical protein [Acetatifactor sp.]
MFIKKAFSTVLAGFCVLALTACQTSVKQERTQTLQDLTITTFATTESETTELETICLCEYPWQHAYAEYIMDYIRQLPENPYGLYGVYIGDINDDEIPEMVIAMNEFHYTTILYYTGDALTEMLLETVSCWGSVTYIADTGQILFSPFGGHTDGTFGYREYYLYSWTGTGYEQTFSLFRDSGYYYRYRSDTEEDFGEYNQGYINGVETDFDTFEAELAHIYDLKMENDYFPVVTVIDEALFERYLEESLLCFVMPDHQFREVFYN